LSILVIFVPCKHLSLITTPCLLSKKIALDELRDDRDHHELDVPLLAKSIRVMNHILSRKNDPDWNSAKLHNFGDAQADGDGPDVSTRVSLPVRQDVATVSTLSDRIRSGRLRSRRTEIGKSKRKGILTDPPRASP
jgi:hypothetical protein